jgi:hypothetical protein
MTTYQFNSNDQTTVLTWRAIDGFTLDGDGKHFWLFGFTSTVVKTVLDQSVLRIPALQLCENGTFTNWNQTVAGHAEPAPSIVAFQVREGAEMGKSLNFYGNNLINTPPATLSSTASNSDSMVKSIGIAAIVIAVVSLLFNFYLLSRLPSAEETERQRREWADKRLQGLTTSS